MIRYGPWTCKMVLSLSLSTGSHNYLSRIMAIIASLGYLWFIIVFRIISFV